MGLAHVLACSQEGVLGRNGTLPWHLPEDLAYFKQLTMGQPIIMGRKTFESLPAVLPGRHHYVLSRKAPAHHQVTILRDLASVQRLDHGFIIGGGEVFSQTLSMVSTIYLTLVDALVDGDTFYPLEQIRERPWQKIGQGPGFTHYKINWTRS